MPSSFYMLLHDAVLFTAQLSIVYNNQQKREEMDSFCNDYHRLNNKCNKYHSISKDNAAARRRHRRRICKYAEDADDEANKVSRRKRIGMSKIILAIC